MSETMSRRPRKHICLNILILFRHRLDIVFDGVFSLRLQIDNKTDDNNAHEPVCLVILTSRVGANPSFECRNRRQKGCENDEFDIESTRLRS